MLERWKYEFEKYHNKVANVYKKCNKFHSVFFQHFGYRFRGTTITTDIDRTTDYESDAPIPKSKYIPLAPTTLTEREDHVLDIIDSGFSMPKSKVIETNVVTDAEEEDVFYHDTHDQDSSSDNERNVISPILLATASNNSTKYKKMDLTPSDGKFNE